MVDIVDVIVFILGGRERRGYGRGHFAAAHFGFRVNPVSCAVEKQLAADASVKDLHFGHTALIINIQNSGIGIVRLQIVIHTAHGF